MQQTSNLTCQLECFTCSQRVCSGTLYLSHLKPAQSQLLSTSGSSATARPSYWLAATLQDLIKLCISDKTTTIVALTLWLLLFTTL